MANSTTLHSFCKTYNLPKTTVHRYCTQNGIPTSEGLSADAVQKLIVAFRVDTIAALPAAQTTETAQEQDSKQLRITHVPKSHIQVLPPEKSTGLSRLKERYVKPKTFQAVNANGSAEQVVDGVFMLADIVEQMKSSNDEAEQQLEERAQSIDDAAEILDGLTKEVKSEFERNADIAEKSETVESKAEQLKKKLAALQSFLGS